ncbi:putative aldehyde dehydrogenase-like protein [Smittium mucronatum]|uniref:Putative aldehyde dehydrogenase-like protein n=1 Tax=Smittium mucronatum TaxID=133383 RepID=A0A1R0GVZ4_9FUNG|nr:putative aldehyde dehydrogenase-like protein [Smittium mucronatum]
MFELLLFPFYFGWYSFALSILVAWYYLVPFSKRFIDAQLNPPKKIRVQLPIQFSSSWTSDNYFDGSSKQQLANQITCVDPSTGAILGYCPVTSPSEVFTSAKNASLVQKVWVNTSFSQRRQVLRTICDFILENQLDICRAACRDSGKTFVDAMLGEVLTTVAKLRWTIENGEEVLKSVPRKTGFLMMYKMARVVYQPMGVVASIVSWNYPFHNALGPIISAIFAGNGIVVKVSEHSAFSSAYFLNIVRSGLAAHGHPTDLVQFVTGYAETGQALVTCPLIKHVTFIGSAPIGRLIMKAASENLTPVTLELGGKDCAIVMPDANLSQCVPVIMRGTFQNSGQNCIGLERIIVHSDIYDSFISLVKEKIPKIRQGPCLEDSGKPHEIDMGAMVLQSNFKVYDDLIADAIQHGAKLLYGGKRFMHPSYPHGNYFMPTLIVDLTPDMKIANTEVFGPIMAVFKASSVSDSIRIANSSQFALGASVFTSNKALGRQISMSLKCGMVNNNDFAVNYLCQSLPFGGIGQSGFGRFAGPEGLLSMCYQKSYTEDIFPFISTTIPKVVDYPISNTSNAFEFTKNINTFAFGSSFFNRVKAAVSLGKLSQ